MKNEWETKKLSDVATLQRGFDLPTRDRVNGEFPLVSSSGISDTHHKSAVLGPGVVTGRSGSIGNVFFIEDDFWPLNTVLYVKDFHDNDPRFVFHLLKKFDLKRFASGAGVPTLNRNFVHNELVKVPSLPEQQRIVGILDEAFAGIATAKANAENNLQNARALFESYLQSVFTQRDEGWVEKTLGDIAQVKGGKRVPKGYKLQTEPTNYPYLRVTEFTDAGSIDTSDLRYVSPEIHREIKKYVIYSTDLYISIAGTIGKTGIIPAELDGANLTENACRLIFNPDINERFVYYFTLTAGFIEQAGLNTRTAAQPKLALSRLSTIRLGIPDLADQRRLAFEFDALREETQRLEAIYQQKLDMLKALKKSLLHQAFTGAL
ncbi:MAG: restriction endonuclease subunit S [Thermoleophilia bacterium]